MGSTGVNKRNGNQPFYTQTNVDENRHINIQNIYSASNLDNSEGKVHNNHNTVPSWRLQPH